MNKVVELNAEEINIVDGGNLKDVCVYLKKNDDSKYFAQLVGTVLGAYTYFLSHPQAARPAASAVDKTTKTVVIFAYMWFGGLAGRVVTEIGKDIFCGE